MSDLRELEVRAGMEAEKHRPDETRGGCECGFCAWSVEHAVIMSVRAALAAHEAAPNAERDRLAAQVRAVEAVDFCCDECWGLVRAALAPSAAVSSGGDENK